MSIKLTESIVVDQNQEKVFEFTQDYQNRLKWDTFLKVAYLKDTIVPDVGVKAWCVSKHNLGMETEYVSFRFPYVTAVKMTKGPFFFKSFAGSWKFDQVDVNITKVTFTYSFILRFPLNLLDFVVKYIMIKNVRQRLKDLKMCIEDSSRDA